MDFHFLRPWHRCFPRAGEHVISFFGGGGKTALLETLANVYRAEGIPVIATTTTRTEPLLWPGLEVVDWGEIAAGHSPLRAPVVYVRDGILPDGKWGGLAPESADRLSEIWPERVVLVEADGSAGLPVKLHREDEPIWPSCSSLAVAVMGLSAIGMPARDVLHRCGRLPAPCLANDRDETLWQWEHMFRLLAGSRGYLSRVPAEVPSLLALTQMEGMRDSVGLFQFVERVMTGAGVPLVMFCELAREEPYVQTVYSDEQQKADSDG